MTNSPKSPGELIQERKSTHGSWKHQASLAHDLKECMHKTVAWPTLSAMQKEALDMIALKTSRIIIGNADEPDHWDDIAGYALLGKGGHPDV